MSMNLAQYLEHHADAHMGVLISAIADVSQSISAAVHKGALGGVLGSLDSENVQGEVQKKLDIISNEILLEANEWGGHLAAMASEEMESIHQIPNRYPKGEYMLTFDPLDGSSNIDVNVSIGTIFSVLRKVGHARGVSEEANDSILEDVGAAVGARPDPDHPGWLSWGDFPRGSFAAASDAVSPGQTAP